MLPTVRSVLEASWPIVGTLYLAYLALQAPPIRYVGLVGLAVVTPLLAGWIVGTVFDVGPWADGNEDRAADGNGGDDGGRSEGGDEGAGDVSGEGDGDVSGEGDGSKRDERGGS